MKLEDTTVDKVDKFSLDHYPKNEFEKNEMQNIPYTLVVGSLMYVQV